MRVQVSIMVIYFRLKRLADLLFLKVVAVQFDIGYYSGWVVGDHTLNLFIIKPRYCSITHPVLATIPCNYPANNDLPISITQIHTYIYTYIYIYTCSTHAERGAGGGRLTRPCWPNRR